MLSGIGDVTREFRDERLNREIFGRLSEPRPAAGGRAG